MNSKLKKVFSINILISIVIGVMFAIHFEYWRRHSEQNTNIPIADFLVLKPYVDKQTPGVFSTVLKRDNTSVSLSNTCNIPSDFTDPLIEKYRTVDQDVVRKLETGYDADISILPTNGSINLRGLSNVRIKYKNSKIWALTTENLYRIREKYLVGDCEKAVIHEIRSGMEVCQTKKIIVSDIVIELNYDAGIKLEFNTSKLDIDASNDITEKEMQRIFGDKMIHAVSLLKSCITLNTEKREI